MSEPTRQLRFPTSDPEQFTEDTPREDFVDTVDAETDFEDEVARQGTCSCGGMKFTLHRDPYDTAIVKCQDCGTPYSV
jgi:hypothetical protein